MYRKPSNGFVVDLLRTQNKQNIIIKPNNVFRLNEEKLNTLLDTYKIIIVYPISIHNLIKARQST